MPSIWKLLTTWGPLILFFVPFLASWLSLWSFGKEVGSNEKFDEPEKHQVYWHVVFVADC
jgi:hypothetical protein